MTTIHKNNVPELRFPEFLEKWEEKKLGQLTQKVNSGSTPRGGVSVYQKIGIPFIRSQNINNNNLVLDDDICISEILHSEMKNSKVLPLDVLLNITGASIGRSAVVPKNFKDGNVNQHVCIIRLKTSSIPFFIQAWLSSYNGQKAILRTQVGGGREGLNFQGVRSLKLHIPPLPEQQKIASFLSSVDKKIDQLTRKKQLWERYKKGMMQQIFSQEIRFKDENGQDFPDWEEKRLGDVYDFKSTNSLSRDKLGYEGGEVRNIHYGDIHTKFQPAFHLLQEQVPFIDLNVDLSRISKDKYCQQGDLVIADASEDYDDIGKTIELINLNNEKVLAGLHTLLARLISEDIYIGFGNFLMASSSVRKQIKIIAQGTKVLGISAGRMEEISLSLPKPKEQKKIADFLSSIDKKISIISSELEKSKSFKKALLQQMFV